MDTRIWHRRRCSACYAEMAALSRQGIVICDECEMRGATVEKVERKRAAYDNALREEMAAEARVAANATCSRDDCPCHKAPGAR